MKPSAFEYFCASSLDQAFRAFSACSEEPLYLAGGQSVVPSLNMRLQAPTLLIDISRLEELSGIAVSRSELRIGALTTHADLADSDLVALYAPLLVKAAPHVAHPAIRNRGTIGGNVALADPASEFPAALVAMQASIEIGNLTGVRSLPAEQFFLGLYETALEPGDIVTAVLVPKASPTALIAFEEISRRRGDYATVGAAVQIDLTDGGTCDASIVFCSVGDAPVRARRAEGIISLSGLNAESIAAAQAELSFDLDPLDESHMPAKVRVHLARVLLGRMLLALEAEQ